MAASDEVREIARVAWSEGATLSPQYAAERLAHELREDVSELEVLDREMNIRESDVDLWVTMRCAELRRSGVDAVPVIFERNGGYTCAVRMSDGTIQMPPSRLPRRRRRVA